MSPTFANVTSGWKVKSAYATETVCVMGPLVVLEAELAVSEDVVVVVSCAATRTSGTASRAVVKRMLPQLDHLFTIGSTAFRLQAVAATSTTREA